MDQLQPHLKIKPGDIAEIVLIPGDPARVKRIAEYWDESREVAFNREFLTYTGKYKGIPISATSTGIGSPSAAIAVEELAKVGAKIFIRIGTCGALKKTIVPGNLIIPDKAIRQEGTTKEYVGEEFEAKPDPEVFQVLKQAADELNIKYFIGTNRTHDSFYEPTENFLKLMDQSEYKKGELVSSEMECSAVFTLAQLRGLKAGTVLSVNTTEPLDEIAKDPGLIYKLETSAEADQGVDKAIKVALRAVELLSK
ncbi:MAG: nucleoside phosphorylase [Patescibacteria group bacterium]|nr:nucleoside phosphorylase [Patescibacteria group bacterium]